MVISVSVLETEVPHGLSAALRSALLVSPWKRETDVQRSKGLDLSSESCVCGMRCVLLNYAARRVHFRVLALSDLGGLISWGLYGGLSG